MSNSFLTLLLSLFKYIYVLLPENWPKQIVYFLTVPYFDFFIKPYLY